MKEMINLREMYTIGFTQKTAEDFFTSLTKNNIELILDIRLNNTSQLAAFSKYPDIKYFLREICNIEYIHDVLFSPDEITLKRYKSKEICWELYAKEFEETMIKRNINDHITKKYSLNKNICLLCSESKPEHCHRSLVANKFITSFKDIKIIPYLYR